MTEKKVVFVGNTSSYKSSVLAKLVNGDNNCRFSYPTMGVFVSRYTSGSGKKYNVWDCAGNPKFAGLKDGYYIQADMAFIFLGGKGKITVEEWKRDLLRVSPNIKIHVVNGDLQEKYSTVKSLLE